MSNTKCLNDFYNDKKIFSFEGHSQLSNDETIFLKNIINDNSIRTILEIGFNGGHSSETFLSTNQATTVVSFDIGHHHYVNVGKQYIDQTYPGRHELIIGNSLVTIPEYYYKNANKQINNNGNGNVSDLPCRAFDLVFIDGGHQYQEAHGDLLNCKYLSHPNTIVIMDDTMDNPDWIQSWNRGPNRAWKSGIENNIIMPLGSRDFSPRHGLSWGRYILH